MGIMHPFKVLENCHLRASKICLAVACKNVCPELTIISYWLPMVKLGKLKFVNSEILQIIFLTYSLKLIIN
jgi:hypothetical protein